MASLTCPDPAPVRLDLDRRFRRCEPRDGDEIYPNGIFKFNITRLLIHIDAAEDSLPRSSRWTTFLWPARARG